ncbi:putative ketosteroid isomerase-related protein [Parvibaculum lavamentivorans DS-1]|uniref:Putative ketosteroid isomerase-related protein n=1 Tax=Parvibaculum lavamentivorans (strain DS-1 / DSM 13023 / NCIMB 13966) TaxID=402881 RepID=A7HV36_PARL1|nr:nuclear transport factor 2 family protein [Parvibaculum lavamentivorans]ABS63769.1 putative ketosteroid isomerase-related protein [Parvibaculum lavamentivorans DS-1]
MSNDEAANLAAANLAVVRRYAEAWEKGDLAAIVACYHDDFTLHYGGAHSLAGTHAGKPAALAALAEFSKRTGRKLVAILDVMAGQERAVVIAREHFDNGALIADVERVLVYRIADGLLRECWLHDADQPLIDRLLAVS